MPHADFYSTFSRKVLRHSSGRTFLVIFAVLTCVVVMLDEDCIDTNDAVTAVSLWFRVLPMRDSASACSHAFMADFFRSSLSAMEVVTPKASISGSRVPP